MVFTNYIYGSLVWISVGCILCIGSAALSISSLVTKILPSPQYKRVSEQMTDIVSSYGFHEKIVDVSGVKIHCVIKENVPIYGLTSGGGLIHLTAK